VRQSPRINADDLSSGIHERPAGKSRIQSQVEPNVLIEISTTPVPPLPADAANDPAARHYISASRAPERKNQMAEPESGRVAELGRGGRTFLNS
jgi:hypothetical protein